VSAAPLYGLVLAGGRSRRMQRDKAQLPYAGKPQLLRAMELLAPLTTRRFVSVRADQTHDPQRAAFELIADIKPDLGPIGGIHAALHRHPGEAWLVLACDLPFLDQATLQFLIDRRASARLASAFRSQFDGLPEPLCAIYEPRSAAYIDAWIEAQQKCPRAFLAQHDVELLDLPRSAALDNINNPDEYASAAAALQQAPARQLTVRYFALLREQAGRASEQLQTQAHTPQELYDELRRRRGLTLAPQFLRVAVNDEFGDWQAALNDGDTIAFLPPVAGG